MITEETIRPIAAIRDEMKEFWDAEIVPDDDKQLEWINRLTDAITELRFRRFM